MPDLPDIKRGDPITAADENAKRALLRRLNRTRGPWSRTGGAWGMQPNLRGWRPVMLYIVSAAATGVQDANANSVQWIYQVREVYAGNTGYRSALVTKWKTVTGGYLGNGYNFAEDGNTGAGRQKNGTDHDGTLYSGSSFVMQPAPSDRALPGVIVWADDEDGSYPGKLTQEAWFDWNNREDGEC